LDPRYVDAHAYAGNVLRQLQQPHAALQAYDRALALKPDAADVHYNRGTLLQQLQQPSAALQSFESALSIMPTMGTAHLRRADMLLELGQSAAAEAGYHHAAALIPNNAMAFAGRGLALMALNRPREALASFDTAIALKPDMARVLSNRALAQARLGLLAEARASHDQATQLDPRDAQVQFNRGSFLSGQREWAAALPCYEAAIALNPDYVDAYCNLGLCQQELEQPDQALASYAHALHLDPKLASVFNNRGNLLRARKQFDAALRDYQQALAIVPQDAEAHYNRGQLALLQGNFALGWPEYEWRNLIEEAKGLAPRKHPAPVWSGESSLQGARIILYAEQGLGDTLQMCRYTASVAALGAGVILEVQPPLRELLMSLPGVSQLVPAGSALPAADFQCSLMSLPAAFKTTLDTIPHQIPYVHADSEKVAGYRTMFGPQTRPRVGLAWSGNPNHRNDRHRSIAFSQLLEHLPASCEYFCVQTQIRDSDRQTLRSQSACTIHEPPLETFTDTAALLETLDVLICVDTSIAHLSGAMGRPTWILLPYLPDWRWLLDRKDSPWYPTATLYRQSAPNDWDGVLRRVASDLISEIRA
jgi:Tfp pilus assembly protein PilF